MMMKWLEIWNNRLIKPVNNLRKDEILGNLLAMDGFDSITGSICPDEWLKYLDYLSSKINVKRSDSFFEVGCGSGAFLYPFYLKGHKVAGLDYSSDLVLTAQSIMPEMNFYIKEAVLLETFPAFDHLVSSSVFFYFRDYDYASQVLDLMVSKCLKSVVILDVPDLATKDECELYRKGALTEEEYSDKYKGLNHLYYPRAFWLDYAGKNELEVEITQQRITGYCNNSFRYNVVLRRP